MLESTETLQYASYLTSMVVCIVLAVYFLRIFLNTKSTASVWWSAGFSVYAGGIVLMIVTGFHGVHSILVMFTGACIATSVPVLYYAASLRFFEKKSFFREKFTVILFVISYILLLLFVYYLPEEYIVQVVNSKALILFITALLLVAVLFSQFVERLFQKYHCRRVNVVQSLAWWMITVGSLCIVLFFGSIAAVGLIFVLSLFMFILLLYDCTRGDLMEITESEEERELSIQRINGIEYEINRKIGSIHERLHDAMQKIGVALLHTMTAKDEQGNYLLQESTELQRKNKMVTRASTLGIKEDELAVHIAELAKNILKLAKSAYEDSTPQSSRDRSRFNGANPHRRGPVPDSDHVNWVPMGSTCAELGAHVEGGEEAGSGKIRRLATLAFLKNSTDRNVIEACCELVQIACYLENYAVTEIRWESPKDEEHLGGMIGHTYNILRAYGKRTGITEYAEDFKEKFQRDANEGLKVAEGLWSDATVFLSELPDFPSEGQADKTAGYLKKAIDLLQKTSLLVKDASDFVENRLDRPGL